MRYTIRDPSESRQVCFALAVASRTVIGLYRPLLKRREASGLVVRRREPRDDRAIERLGMELSELEEIRDRITARIEATRRET